MNDLSHTDLNLKDALVKTLIRLLDGTRTRADLLRDLTAEGVPVTPDGLEETLDYLARLCLLTG